MNTSAFIELLRRRWRLIAVVVGLALAAAGAYAWGQRRVFESTATLYVRPSPALLSQDNPALTSSELGVLSYGSLVNTVLSIAQSRTMLRTAASGLGLGADQLSGYATVATARPKSFVLDISVDGPDRSRVVALANGLSQSLIREVGAGFSVVALSPLAPASKAAEIQPRLKRDLVYGALAGLIIGFVLAAASLASARTHEPGDAANPSEEAVEPVSV